MATKLSTHFHDILKTGLRKRIIPAKSKEARDWYRQAAREVTGRYNKRDFITGAHDDKKIAKSSIAPGDMVLFNYDPKHKKTLPIYDTFPLIFPFSIDDKGRIYGINMHYLTKDKRAKLMDALHTITNNQKYDRSTKLKISYKILKNLAGVKGWEETIHCYLPSHIKSRVRKIDPRSWDSVLMLPLAKWNGPKAAQYQGR